MTLKLFAHTHREEAYAQEAMREQTEKLRSSSRMVTGMDVSITSLNGLLIAGTSALALWLWVHGMVSTGQVALAVGLVIRINNMSGWIMWVVNGIFENVGTVQDGITTISQERTVLDREGATPLRVTRGEVRFDDIHFHYGDRYQTGVLHALPLALRHP